MKTTRSRRAILPIPLRRRPRRVHTQTQSIDIGGRTVPLTLRRDARAGRLRLKIDPGSAGLVLTLPPRASEESGLAFIASQREWITTRLESLPPSVPFVPGAIVPVLGEPHHIRCEDGGRIARRATVSPRQTPEGAELVVRGHAEHCAGAVLLWLREEARRVLSERAQAKAALLGRGHGRPLGRISVRDTRTRWGSCSATGNLSFCWRLIMAPPHVLDYVVAHEVAHLAVRDHSAQFWRAVAGLTPHVDAARDWLHRHGHGLVRYG